MTELQNPDRSQVETWLQQAHVEYYDCGECDGLHINAVENQEGVVNSRVILQDHGLLFSTEIEVRPMAILALSADLGRLNIDYPSLKVFLDVVDDASPQLVAADYLLAGAGVTPAQFSEFVVTTMEGTMQLADECLRMDYLFVEPGQTPSAGGHAVH